MKKWKDQLKETLDPELFQKARHDMIHHAIDTGDHKVLNTIFDDHTSPQVDHKTIDKILKVVSRNNDAFYGIARFQKNLTNEHIDALTKFSLTSAIGLSRNEHLTDDQYERLHNYVNNYKNEHSVEMSWRLRENPKFRRWIERAHPIPSDIKESIVPTRPYGTREIQRQTWDYFGNSKTRGKFLGAFKNKKELQTHIKDAPQVYLKPDQIRKLQNSDAGSVLVSKNRLKAARGIVSKEDSTKLYDLIDRKKPIPSPVVIKKRSVLYLLGGNKRLVSSIAKGKNLPVKVLDLDEINKQKKAERNK